MYPKGNTSTMTKKKSNAWTCDQLSDYFVAQHAVIQAKSFTKPSRLQLLISIHPTVQHWICQILNSKGNFGHTNQSADTGT